MEGTIVVPNRFGIRALNLIYNDILGGLFFSSHPVKWMQNGRLANLKNDLCKNHQKWKSLGVQSKFFGKTRVRGRNSAPHSIACINKFVGTIALL